MRKTVLLLASMVLALVLVSGVAWAVTKDCRAGADYCIGTNGPDIINGSEEKDKIRGLDGNDKLLGNGGNDNIVGGGGVDIAKGGLGVDRLDGGVGDDKLYGGPDDDYIIDYPYDSRTDTQERDLLSGGKGNDFVYGANKLRGGPGDDRIETYSPFGSGPPRTISGGGGEDRIKSTDNYDDTIYVADDQRDTVNCAGGKDTVYFDKGIDSVNPINCENRIPSR